MLYQQPRFTCSAANSGTSDIKWDMAFLTADEFKTKYGCTVDEYLEREQFEQS